MNTTVKSLQDVYVALGGKLTDTYEDIDGGVPVSDYTTIPDVIEAISQLAGKTLKLPKTTSADTGKLLVVNEDGDWDKGDAPEELPDVTASDNGSVLSVVNGAWAKKTPNFSDGEITNLRFEIAVPTTISLANLKNEMILIIDGKLATEHEADIEVYIGSGGAGNVLFTMRSDSGGELKTVIKIDKTESGYILTNENKYAMLLESSATSINIRPIPSDHFNNGTVTKYVK